MRILIVDDSKAMRMIVRRQLGQTPLEEFELDEADNGREALEKLRSGGYDLVFADWNMPVMDGRELLETLRAEGNHTPLGFVTSATQQVAEADAFEAGAQFVIVKPFTAETFQRALERVL